MPEPVDIATTNGAVMTTGITRARLLRRRLMIGALVLFVAAWTVAIIYSVTAGGRSPERLDDADAHTVSVACLDARRQLSALPPASVKAPFADRADRVVAEDEILTAMVSRLRRVHPAKSTPATALNGWLDDWQRLVTARQHYASDLSNLRAAARFVEPATKGVDPIADKMNNWILEQGTRTDACNTGELQAEVVEGPRTYGPATKS